MSADIIYALIYNSITATVIASVALVVSLYLFQKELASGVKKSVTRKRRKTVKKKPFAFSFPQYMRMVSKDFGTLLLLVIIGVGFFALNTLAKELEVSKYIGLGLRYVEHVAHSSSEDTQATVLASEDAFLESEIIASSTEDVLKEEVQTMEEEEKVIEEKKTAPAVQELPVPKIVLPPLPPPVVVPLIIKDPPRPEYPEANGPASDAVVKEKSFNYYGGELVEGESLHFSAIVLNNGEKEMESTFNTQLYIDEDNDGKTELHLSRLETRALKSGEFSEAKTWRGAWIAKSGTHRAYVCADTENTLFEMNEKNNCTEIVFTVKGHEISGDLAVQNFLIVPSIPKTGENVAFSAIILNKAPSPAKKSYAHLIIDINAPYKKFVPSLLPDKFEKVEWGTIWKASSGEHTFSVCADGGGEVFETDENNNCSQLKIFVAEQ
ncbi:MAG: hypothetical protein HYT93_04385 [Parcubacteria group bacterium]|nr:hypothetical protein [Parcubacteria group bacterium]